MKLSNFTTKLTCIKGKAVRVLAAGMLAGAVLTAVAPAAQAQQFGVGVQFGPRYAPAPPPPRFGYGYGYGYHYGYPGYWEHRRFEDARRAEFYRHDEWVRAHHPYGYGIRPY